MRASKVLVIPSSSASGWEQGAVSLLLSFPSLLSLCMYLTLSPLYSNIFPFEHNNSNNFHVTLSPGPVSAQRLLAGTPMCPGALSWDPCLRQLHVAPCSTWTPWPLKTQQDGHCSLRGLTWSTSPGHRWWKGKRLWRLALQVVPPALEGDLKHH